jgi:hypothetical protein
MRKCVILGAIALAIGLTNGEIKFGECTIPLAINAIDLPC